MIGTCQGHYLSVMSKTLLIAGATGLIGSTTLQFALKDARFSHVIVVARRPLGIAHPKLTEWTHPDLLLALRNARVDAVLCCLGTTMRQVGGDKGRFIHVDKDLVLGLGRWARDQGVPVCGVVSAVGADAASRIFYNRVKGEMEEGLRAQGHPVLHIFQPSILTGPRSEVRVGERIGIAIASVLAPITPMRYRPMPHDVLAAALLNAVFQPTGGTHDTAGIRRLAAG
jgi:uncharacterized protein YbjT (DUF2867 family)